MNDAILERMNIEKHLRTALENNEFSLYYQPQLNVKSGKITGFEALIRWNSPQLGMVSPLKFIHIAEDSQLIIPIGEWVLRSACMFIKGLHMQGYTQYTISVNISILQLIQDNFIDVVHNVLDSIGLSPSYLELEITESMLMESFDAINKKLEKLREKGIRIALDDFGKGYSSLNYLKQLPISTLKIDKTFIDNISNSDNSSTLSGTIVMLGHNMGLSIVAEGVETKEQFEYLSKHKCDIIQGYLFSKPLQEPDAIRLVMNETGKYQAV